MKVLQVRIDERIRELLQKLARAEGRTESELVREAIARLLYERGLIDAQSVKKAKRKTK